MKSKRSIVVCGEFTSEERQHLAKDELHVKLVSPAAIGAASLCPGGAGVGTLAKR